MRLVAHELRRSAPTKTHIQKKSPQKFDQILESYRKHSKQWSATWNRFAEGERERGAAARLECVVVLIDAAGRRRRALLLARVVSSTCLTLSPPPLPPLPTLTHTVTDNTHKCACAAASARWSADDGGGVVSKKTTNPRFYRARGASQAHKTGSEFTELL